MNRVLLIIWGICSWFSAMAVYATDKFEVLPDLPAPLAYSGQTAQASAVYNPNVAENVVQQSVGHEPDFVSIIFSMLFVILLIYVTGIIYAKLNKLGLNTLKKQMGDSSRSHVSVVSTTALGNNKTLHVVELDGKRMLIGASVNSIHLIKDLGTFSSSENIEEGEYSKIEIPHISIPKIEIPKIEIPSIDFSKLVTKSHSKIEEIGEKEEASASSDGFEISGIEEVYEEENSDGIIDKLFTVSEPNVEEEPEEVKNEHKVDPDNFALYKKYL